MKFPIYFLVVVIVALIHVFEIMLTIVIEHRLVGSYHGISYIETSTVKFSLSQIKRVSNNQHVNLKI